MSPDTGTGPARLPVVLLLPGQGAQHPRMAAGLYDHDETFTYWMNEAFSLFQEDGPRLRREWLARRRSAEFDDVTVAQPLLYAVNHALGQMVLGWGIRPVALLGHSVGEFAAATLAGVLDFPAGARLMSSRIRSFAATEPGGMLAVAASVSEIADLLGSDIHLAAVNAARQLLLAGERGALDNAARQLKERGFTCRDVLARQAFHSPVVDDAVRGSLAEFRAVTLRPPRLTVYSAYTGGVLTDELAVDGEFWAWQAARTVYFAPTLTALLDEHDCLLLETGPGDGLTRVARRQRRVFEGRSRAQPLLPGGLPDDLKDRAAAAEALQLVLSLASPGEVTTSPQGGRSA
jgi:acyl transferase domain-containing protein